MILNITVKPNSNTDQILFDHEHIKVKIRAQPVDGKANKYLINFLSISFEIPKSSIEILKGSTHAHKKISIEADENMIWEKMEKFKVKV